VSLTNANTVDTIAARITGAGATLTFNDTANNLTIGTVGGVSGVQTNNGDITLRTTTSGNIALNRSVNAGTGTVTVAALGNLAIGAGGSVSAGGGATLAAQGNFANAAGAGAITVGAGSRWLVYSTDPSADTDGGLTPNFIQYAAPYNFGTLTGTAPATTGNGFLYSLTPAALTLTGVTKTYDGTTGLSGASFTASGAMAGDTVTLGGSPTGSFAGKNAGTGIDVTVNGLAVTATHGGIAVYGYTVASVTNDPIGTIDPKTVTAGLTGTVTKVYDGTTAATLAAGNYTLTGIIAGDAVSLNDPTSGTYASPAAGTGIAVTVNGVALTGAEAGNYRLAATTLTAGIGTITPTVVTPPPPPPPPPHVVLPPTPFIPVQPPQPAQQAADPGAIAAAAHALVVPTPELADLARLSGCSGGDFVAVVPGEDGHVGAVVIEAEGNKTVLHAAYAGCSGSKPVITSPQEVNRLFGGALAARPTPPVNFEVYYNTGSARLEPDALAMLDKAFAEIARRKPVDVVVTGFTDTVGTPQGNDLLSLARAQQVTKLLLARGLMPGAVATFGRGQRDPQVPTPAQVAEEKNRRVEITVR
jgi:outer membrane protein OmpA-like peptidoglycan-associated protein